MHMEVLETEHFLVAEVFSEVWPVSDLVCLDVAICRCGARVI